MSLWTQFGPEDDSKMQERILQMIEFQGSQLNRLTDPIIGDIDNRLDAQERTLRQIYLPITHPLRRQVKRNGEKLQSFVDYVNCKIDEVTGELICNTEDFEQPPGEGQSGDNTNGNGEKVCQTICYRPISPTWGDVEWNNYIEQLTDPNFTQKCTFEVRLGSLFNSRLISICCDNLADLNSTKTALLQVLQECFVLDSPPIEGDGGNGDGGNGDGGNGDGGNGDGGNGDCKSPCVINIPPCPQCPPCPPIQLGGDGGNDDGNDDGFACPPPEITNVVNVPPCPTPTIEIKPDITVDCKFPETQQVCCVTSGDVKGEAEVIPNVPAQGEMWEPDTERICHLIEDYVRRFTAVGNAVMASFTTNVNAASTIIGTAAPVTNVILQAMEPIANAIDPQRFVGVINGVVRNLTAGLVQGMTAQGEAYVGLSVIKLVLETLESVTVGWNLGPVVMFQLKITLTKEKQVLEYLRNFLWPTDIPSSSDVGALLVTQQISDRHADCLWRMNSSLPVLERKIAYARRQQVSAETLVKLWMKDQRPIQETIKRIVEQGWQNPREIDELFEASKIVPSPSDAISMSVRDVFDPNLPGKQQMIAEYRIQNGLSELFRATGIGKVHIAGISPATNDIVDVGLLYWLSHYQHCSPTQVYEMMHRLRPNRVNKWALPGQTPEQINAMMTDINLVRSLLKLNDYNPIWRDRLAAIAYRPIGRIDARKFYGTKVLGTPLGREGFRETPTGLVATGIAEKELVEIYLDMGYSPSDALQLTIFTAFAWDDANLEPLRKITKKNVCEGITVGYISPEQGENLLVLNGVSEKEAQLTVWQCEHNRKVSLLKRTIRYVRGAYLGGRLLIDGVRSVLNRLQITPEVIDDYVMEWTTQVQMRAKEPEAQKLCEWFGQNLLSLDDFITRLQRLGYTTQDTRRIIVGCMIGIQGRNAKEQRRMAAMIEKQKKQQEQADRKKLREFLSARSEAHLIEWYCAKQITKADIVKTLNLKGWADDDIQRFLNTLEDKCNGKEKKTNTDK